MTRGASSVFSPALPPGHTIAADLEMTQATSAKDRALRAQDPVSTGDRRTEVGPAGEGAAEREEAVDGKVEDDGPCAVPLLNGERHSHHAGAKVSISLAAEDAEWAFGEARARKLVLSALVSEGIHRQRRHAALGSLLSELGVKLTATELAALRAELYSKV